jgi:hypothetical protein
MAKLNLSRTYTYMGKDYGPGNDIDVPDDIPSGVKDVPGLRPADDIKAKEDAYQQYLRDGGEPVAPITPGILGTDNEPEGRTSLPKPRPKAPAAAQPDTADRKTFRRDVQGESPAPATPKEYAAKRGEKDQQQ